MSKSKSKPGLNTETLTLATYDGLAELGKRLTGMGAAGKDFAFEVGNLVQQANARRINGELSDDGWRKVIESARQALESKAAQLGPDAAKGALEVLGVFFRGLFKALGL